MRKLERTHQRDLEIHKAKQRLMPYFARVKSLTEMVDNRGNSSDIKDVDVFIANISKKRFDFLMRRQIIKGVVGTGIFALGGALGGMVINGARVLQGNLNKENIEQIARDAYIQGAIPGAAVGASVATYLFRQGMRVTKENFEANKRILLSTFTGEEQAEIARLVEEIDKLEIGE